MAVFLAQRKHGGESKEFIQQTVLLSKRLVVRTESFAFKSTLFNIGIASPPASWFTQPAEVDVKARNRH